MPISKQFEQGNYNSWQHSVNELMPTINKMIREDLLITLDKTLTSMVGSYSDIVRKSIDVSYILNDTSIDGMTCHIVYNVDDFKVANVPDDAVKTDRNAISKQFEEKPYHIKSISIDTNNGDVNIMFEFLYEDLDDKA